MGRRPGGTPGTLTPGQGLYDVSSTPVHRIGETFRDDVRTFVYGQAATAIAAGLLAATDQSVIGSDNLLADGSCVALAAGTARADQPAITAALAVGDEWMAVTHASSLDNVLAGSLTNGYVLVTDSTATTGMDRIYEIEWNSKMASDIVAIKLKDPINVATVDAATGVQFMQCPGKELALYASGTDDVPVGAPLVAVADNEYAWFQCWGPGMAVGESTTTAYAGMELQAENTGVVGTLSGTADPRVGWGISNITTAGDALLIMWQIMR